MADHTPGPSGLSGDLETLADMLQCAEDMREHYADAHREDSDRMTALLHDGRAALDRLAAAPDLLEAARAAMAAFVHKDDDPKGNRARSEIFRHCPDMAYAATALRNAIAKAEGGS